MAERVITISLRKYLSTQPVTKRRMKAVKYLRNRIAHYSKVKEEDVKLSKELNQLVVKVHSRRMSPVKVRVEIDKGIASAKPFEPKQQAAVHSDAKAESKERRNEKAQAQQPKPPAQKGAAKPDVQQEQKG
jgi:ribosomal protein L31E